MEEKMSLSLFLGPLLVLGFCFIAFGVGVLFFGKKAERTPCGSVPKLKTEPCPSQKAGLCPIEDKSGLIKQLNQSRINFD